MKKTLIEKITFVSDRSNIPKYRQIEQAVIKGVQDGLINKDDSLPSINALCKKYTLSRDTAVKAYNSLKEKGIIDSMHGKGFYISVDKYKKKLNVFVMFDVLGTPYKEVLYRGISDNLKGKADLDFYFHHYNVDLFCSLLEDSKGKYEYYVVMPFPDEKVKKVLSEYDQSKLMLLDINVDFSGKNCSVVRQNHNKELESALDSGIEKIKKYKSFNLVFPEEKNHPGVIKDAFKRFCGKHGIKNRMISSITEKNIKTTEAYLVIEDNDLVQLVKYSRHNKLKIGRDIGIISYNDTPLKEIIERGVTTVSIDFYKMGTITAKQILSNSITWHQEPTKLILRKTL